VSDGEEEKWERPSPIVPMCRIRPASPRVVAATNGVRSPLHHRPRCHTRALATGASGASG
jgi:hypothetical protein